MILRRFVDICKPSKPTATNEAWDMNGIQVALPALSVAYTVINITQNLIQSIMKATQNRAAPSDAAEHSPAYKRRSCCPMSGENLAPYADNRH